MVVEKSETLMKTRAASRPTARPPVRRPNSSNHPLRGGVGVRTNMHSRHSLVCCGVLMASAMFLTTATGWATGVVVSGDTYISPGANSNLNYGTLTCINVGPLGPTNAPGNSALIQMDLNALPSGLTVANIQKATRDRDHGGTGQPVHAGDPG